MGVKDINNFINNKFKNSKTNYFKWTIIALLIPFIFFIYWPIFLIYRCLFFKKQKFVRNYNSEKEINEPKNIINKNDRKYDLILFGVTGFTGKLCYDYLINNYPKLNFAVSGRNNQRIKNITDKYENKKDILVCDIDNYENLETIIKNTKVVISTVGPYYQYGNPIVNICSAYGTDYCDITGETYFLQENIVKYDNLANKTGARIVSFCGLDCLPYDISTYKLNKIIKENDSTDCLKTVKQFNYFNPNISGGTTSTIINTLEKKIERLSFKNKNPLLKHLGEDNLSTSKCQNGVLKSLKFSKEVDKYCSISPLAFANQRLVERSNYLLNYNKNLRYEECLVNASFLESLTSMATLILTFLIFSISAIRNILFKFKLLHSSGEGESLEKLNKECYNLISIGESEKGKRFVTGWGFNKDPGYIETSKMLVESGLTFIFNNNEISEIGGIHTTASCFGDVILKRLKNIEDFQFEILKN